ncbi:rod shape-determining protein [Algoriphagus marincola]|uniref:rod shape-determining protein n=1 Tax=Algoriphagus marincola TaxID=264027 RepID=UPI0004072136|nr:rod shape-determining protein [Algoriphagus marincola]
MLFKFRNSKSFGINLGTCNTLIASGDQMLINEPSIVAVQAKSNQVLAVGNQAMLLHEKTDSSKVKISFPLKSGVIADFSMAEIMIKSFVSQIKKLENKLFLNNFSMLFCVPSNITEVEKRAIIDVGSNSGAGEVLMMFRPMAVAIGSGLDVLSPEGLMIVHIGGGITEIAIISLGGIVYDFSIRTAGNSFNQDIIDFIKKEFNLLIGDRTAEAIKIKIGAVIPDSEEENSKLRIVGKDLFTGIPRSIQIGSVDVALALDKSTSRIEEAIIKVLENSPPELAADFHIKGIYLSGGGALLRGIKQRLENKTRLKVNHVNNPLHASVYGTTTVLKDRKKYKSLFIR